ncbi:MAG: cytochrome c3 family protein [Nitrospirota bacterium]
MKRNINIAIILAIGFGLIISTTFNVYGGSVIGSKHDLMSVTNTHTSYGYVSGGETLFTNDYGEICVYCHTPHSGLSDAPLWNKNVTTTGYTPYTSPTMDTNPTGTISAVSAACLSCHDGTLAADSVINAPGEGSNLTGPWPWNGASASSGHARMAASDDGGFPLGDECGDCHGTDINTNYDGAHVPTAYLSQDLSDDHPISMTYPTPAQDPDFKTTNEVESAGVVLYTSNKVECPSCHNPHDPDVVPFLRISNSGSALCKACHLK